MKKTVFLVFLCQLLCSCTHFLSVKPAGEVIPRTIEDYSSLLQDAIYQIENGDDKFCIGNVERTEIFDTMTDNFEPSLAKDNTLFNFYLGRHVSIHTSSLNAYEDYYEKIARCNIIIERAPNDNKQTYQEVVAAAYTLRGICFYQLLRQYCEPPIPGKWDEQLGVPMILHFDLEQELPRGSLRELIEATEKDFLKAIEFHSRNDEYLFTEDVSKGYLARLYFWTQQWEKAIEISEQLLLRYAPLPVDQYREMMGTQSKTGNMILRSGTNVSTQSVQNRIQNYYTAPLSGRFTKLFTDDEKEKDIRYELFISPKRTSLKYATTCMRGAEMLLIASESYYHTGKQEKALELINRLRRNRIQDCQDYTLQTLPKVDQTDLIKKDCKGEPLTELLGTILSERRKELFMEGDRFFELKRNGRPEFGFAREEYWYEVKQFMYTFPIPLKDIYIQGNSIKQNPGYTEYTIGIDSK